MAATSPDGGGDGTRRVCSTLRFLGGAGGPPITGEGFSFPLSCTLLLHFILASSYPVWSLVASEPQGDILVRQWRNTPSTGVTHTETPRCGVVLTLETERVQVETSIAGGRGQGMIALCSGGSPFQPRPTRGRGFFFGFASRTAIECVKSLALRASACPSLRSGALPLGSAGALRLAAASFATTNRMGGRERQPQMFVV